MRTVYRIGIFAFSTLVVLVVKDLKDMSRSPNVFCTDIATFLNVFARHDVLASIVKESAAGVVEAWNASNGPAEKATVRQGRECVHNLDHRRILWTKGQEQTLQLIVTSHNFTLANQNISSRCISADAC